MASVLRPQATALITGAASGVGFAFAKICREKGLNLALLDIDSGSLQKAKELLTASGNSSLKTEIYDFDVADRTAWASVASKVKDTFGRVDVLMLNAGNSYKPKGDSKLKQYEDLDYWKRVCIRYRPWTPMSMVL
jgi:NADP-dependent 3-hydroxy acid dehydrogenase YdfG